MGATLGIAASVPRWGLAGPLLAGWGSSSTSPSRRSSASTVAVPALPPPAAGAGRAACTGPGSAEGTGDAAGVVLGDGDPRKGSCGRFACIWGPFQMTETHTAATIRNDATMTARCAFMPTR